MYATLTPTDPATGTPELLRRLTDGGRKSLVLALWASEDEARAAAGEATVWEVADHRRGVSHDRPVAAVQATWFHGPRSAEQVAAAERGGRERLWPALQDMDGLVDVLVLVAPDGASVVLGAATDARHFADINRRIMSTELLPGEDPALLTGPDRIETYAVERSTAGVR
jgi:hypothetical protein